jgi:aminoglycoside phosphotransferase (APT) family kinase protein
MTRIESRLNPPPRLTADSVIDYLAKKGVVENHRASVEALPGGVSSDVFMVQSPIGSWVVKQALPRLKVAQEWHASPARIITEAAALRLAERLIPGSVPPVAVVDADRFVLVEERAPRRFGDWRTELLGGGTEHSVRTAARLGEILATLHCLTFGDATLRRDFGDIESFIALRIDPFHTTVAERLPDLSEGLMELADQLIDRRVCLVHGDFSPKNVLADGGDLWVIDWEVAHLGNPIFDVAFLLAHLVCKTVHVAQSSRRFRDCAQWFLASYNDNVRQELRPDPPALIRHTAAVVLARTDGKSPAPYLRSAERDTARRAAVGWLTQPPTGAEVIQQLWRDLQ